MSPCEVTALHFDDLWTGTRIVLSPFLIYTAVFLNFTGPFRNGSMFACSIASSSAAIKVKMSEYEMLRSWSQRHSMVAQQSE